MAASIAPTKATGVIKYSNAGKRIIITTPAKPAPLEIPMIWGSAKGLRIMACKIAPDNDKLMPTSAPTMVRGMRIFQIIWLWGSIPGLSKSSTIWDMVITLEPLVRLKKAPSTAKKANNIKMVTRQAVRLMPKRSTAPSKLLFAIFKNLWINLLSHVLDSLRIAQTGVNQE